MGILVSASKLTSSVTVVKGGFFVEYAYGLRAFKIGAVGTKRSFTATAAGSAVVLRAAMAAAVYYIPWPTVMDWFKASLSWLWDKISNLWARFSGWVLSVFGGECDRRMSRAH